MIPNKNHWRCVQCSTLFNEMVEEAKSAVNYSEPGLSATARPTTTNDPAPHTRGVINGRHSHPPPCTPRAVAEARAFAKQNDYCRGSSDEGPGIEPWMGRKSYFADDVYTRLYPIETSLSWAACKYSPDPAVCSNATTATNATTPDQKCGDGVYVNCELDTSGQCVPKPKDAVTCPRPDPSLDDVARLIPSAPAQPHSHPARAAAQRLSGRTPRHTQERANSHHLVLCAQEKACKEGGCRLETIVRDCYEECNAPPPSPPPPSPPPPSPPPPSPPDMEGES